MKWCCEESLLLTQNGRCAGSRLKTRPAFRPHGKTCTRERSHVEVVGARTLVLGRGAPNLMRPLDGKQRRPCPQSTTTSLPVPASCLGRGADCWGIGGDRRLSPEFEGECRSPPHRGQGLVPRQVETRIYRHLSHASLLGGLVEAERRPSKL